MKRFLLQFFWKVVKALVLGGGHVVDVATAGGNRFVERRAECGHGGALLLADALVDRLVAVLHKREFYCKIILTI